MESVYTAQYFLCSLDFLTFDITGLLFQSFQVITVDCGKDLLTTTTLK